jgi:hypothetical protein
MLLRFILKDGLLTGKRGLKGNFFLTSEKKDCRKGIYDSSFDFEGWITHRKTCFQKKRNFFSTFDHLQQEGSLFF